ncbi:NUDIX domain-containing protein [Clostridium sp. Marseille-Q2269]|uniref:NAD(+) diphosphatase n=1 Tax=Clostridium sp. Marseille-Q2269 TaxID=2942205 RepID=UPI002073788C|nr:NUDIX domain-containing protein [Clostridium sp. Marseille-Q2269]
MRFKYCPLCGEKLIEKYSWDEGGVPYCKNHNIMYFDTPKPCIVVGVVKDDKILLLKQSYIFKNSKVLLSGYVSSGETIEETVHREVKEEAGITIKDLKYLGSDYLDTKDIVMITFMATYEGGELNKSEEVEWMDWIPIKEAIYHMEEDEIGRNVITKIMKY